jgi:hypothetical protein
LVERDGSDVGSDRANALSAGVAIRPLQNLITVVGALPDDLRAVFCRKLKAARDRRLPCLPFGRPSGQFDPWLGRPERDNPARLNARCVHARAVLVRSGLCRIQAVSRTNKMQANSGSHRFKSFIVTSRLFR